MSRAEFYSLTPRAFDRMQKAWAADRRGWHRAIAALRVDVINFSMRAPKKRVDVRDLLPGDDDAGRAPGAAAPGAPRRLTKRMRQEIANGWRAAMRGGVKRG